MKSTDGKRLHWAETIQINPSKVPTLNGNNEIENSIAHSLQREGTLLFS